MTDRHSAFMAEIVANPLDDGVRLEYSDWLEERGEVERASFIRVQIELAGMPFHECDSIYPGCTVYRGKVVQHDHKCRGNALSRRERELFVANKGFMPTEWGPVYESSSNTVSTGVMGAVGPSVYWTYSRGFISTVRCDLQTFIGSPCDHYNGERHDHGPSIHACPVCHGEGRLPGIAGRAQASQPVERWVLTGVEPHQWPRSKRWAYSNDDPRMENLPGIPDSCRVPWAILQHMGDVDHDSRAAAMEALGSAALEYAKLEAAKLSPAHPILPIAAFAPAVSRSA